MADEPTAAVLAANGAFYEAFELRDLRAMSQVWERSERVVCGHPGWPLLRGWREVARSFEQIFGTGEPLQFVLTDTAVEVVGDAAWVTLNENLLGGGVQGTVAATNVFVHENTGWRMVVHHGSPVGRSPDDDA